jgi:hypothetical protein
MHFYFLPGKTIADAETKNGDQRMITMTEHVFEVLVRCASAKKPGAFVFTRDDGRLVKDFRDALVERLHSQYVEERYPGKDREAHRRTSN